jgi:hypothetical protein
VPVVYGGADYSFWLPTSAYINVADFKSVKHLTDYMVYLSENATAYNSYFEWKRHVRATGQRYKTFCDMCVKLHLEDHFGRMRRNAQALDNMKSYFGAKSNCKKTTIAKNGVIRWINC